MAGPKGFSLIRWLCVIVWMALIFLGSSIPFYISPRGPQIIPVLVHFWEYFILAILFIRALHHAVDESPDTFAVISAFLLSCVYGITDELHQLFVPGRVADLMDLVVDCSGALTGIIILIAITVIKNSNKKKTLEEQ